MTRPTIDAQRRADREESEPCPFCSLGFERFRDPWTNQFYHTQGGEETPCEREK